MLIQKCKIALFVFIGNNYSMLFYISNIKRILLYLLSAILDKQQPNGRFEIVASGLKTTSGFATSI